MHIVATFYFRDPHQVISHNKQQTLLIGQVVLALRDTQEFLVSHKYERMNVSKKTTVGAVMMIAPFTGMYIFVYAEKPSIVCTTFN